MPDFSCRTIKRIECFRLTDISEGFNPLLCYGLFGFGNGIFQISRKWSPTVSSISLS